MPPGIIGTLLPNSPLQRNFVNKVLVQKLDSPVFYEVNLEDYWGLNPANSMHRAVADLPIMVDELEAWYRQSETGMADEYDLYSDDIRIIEIPGEYASQRFPVIRFARAINWTWGEIERYRKAADLDILIESLNPVDEKLRLLGEYFNKREHYTALYGYPARRIYGLFSQKGVTRQDAAFQPYRTGAAKPTVRELVLDIQAYVYYFMERANLTSPNQVIARIPPQLMRRLTEPYIAENGDEDGTGLSKLRSADFGINLASLEVHNELKGSNLNLHVPNETESGMWDANFDMMMFKATTYTPERHFFPRKLFAPFQKSTLRYEQISISATSGIIWRDLTKLWQVAYPNSTAA